MKLAFLKRLIAAALAVAASLANASAESGGGPTRAANERGGSTRTSCASEVNYPRAARQGQAACDLPPSRKIDEYGAVSDGGEKARLDKLAALLQGEQEDVKGFIVAYAGRAARAGEALRRADAAKNYLTDKNVFYNSRLNTLDCGRREHTTVELWITPVASAPPVCSPTIK